MSHADKSTQGQPSSQADGRGAGEEAPPLWEWVTAALGLALLLASLGYLLHDAWTAQDRPPAPAIRVLGVEPQQGRFLVRLRVLNESPATAAALRIEGELKRGDEVVERSEMEFPFLPGRSSRDGGLYFSQDPRTLRLELSARSYQRP